MGQRSLCARGWARMLRYSDDGISGAEFVKSAMDKVMLFTDQT